MFRVGWIVALAFYLATAIVTILQFFVPEHKLLICFNLFNESYLEYFLVILTLPAVISFFNKTDEFVRRYKFAGADSGDGR